MNRQAHDPGLKARVRRLYEQHGSRHASQVTGVARRTVNQWARAKGWQRHLASAQPSDQRVQPTVSPVPSPLPKKAASGGYVVQRRRWLERFAARVNAALDQAERCEQAGKAAEHNRWMTSAGIGVDKCEVLAKAIGGGMELADPAQQTARLLELVDVVEDRTGSDG